jgi:elongation factor G
VAVFCAVGGVEPQSETVWRQADRYGVPRIAFVNKMDRIGADFSRTCSMMRERLGARPVPVQLPLGQESSFRGVIDLIEMRSLVWSDDTIGAPFAVEEIPEDLVESATVAREGMVEAACEMDDDLLGDYVAGRPLTPAQLRDALRRGTLEARCTPVLCGAAFRNKGIRPLLDAVVAFLPSPLDVPPIRGTSPGSGAPMTRAAADDEPFAALVFKIMTDPFVGQLAFIRVYSGKLEAGSQVFNVARGRRERVGRLLKMHANKREEIECVWSGDIAAVVGLRTVTTGGTICDEKAPIVLESMDFPEPVIRLAIEPRTQEDQQRLGAALSKLVREDPTFRVEEDRDTGQTIIAGMGELHLEILVDRLQREFGVSARAGRPQVAYFETITGRGEAEGRYVRQSGGRGQYGHVRLSVQPASTGRGLVFENAVTGGAVPKEYVPAVEDGVSQVMDAGILAGFAMRDVRVVLLDGSYHEVDSSDIAFKVAASLAFRDACRQAGLVLLEPIMDVEVTAAAAYMGDVISDLNARRGRIRNLESRNGTQVIGAWVPMAEMFGYATVLRSVTQGRGTYSMHFRHYREVPKTVGEEVLARVSGTSGR